MYTIIHTNCASLKNGDFSQAGYFAAALQKYLKNSNQTCILASSDKGLEVFKRLFSSDVSNQLQIQDVQIPAVDLSLFLNTADKTEIARFIQIGACKLPDSDLLKLVISNDKTQLINVALPHQSDFNFEKRYAEIGLSSLFNADNFMQLGFGEKRIGFDAKKATQDVEVADYKVITNKPYGFVYFSAVQYCIDFVVDYLVTTHQANLCKNYLIIGKIDCSMHALQNFVNFTKHPVVSINYKTNENILIMINPNHKSISTFTINISEIDKLPFETIRVGVIESLPSAKMLTLMKQAILFVGTTGISSMIEALELGKLSLYQFQTINAVFFETYCEALKKQAGNDSKQLSTLLGIYLGLQSWSDTLSDQALEAFVKILKNTEFCAFLSKHIQQLIKNHDGAIKKVADKLNLNLNQKYPWNKNSSPADIANLILHRNNLLSSNNNSTGNEIAQESTAETKIAPKS